MANKTTNYGLTKPLQSEFYDVDVQNANMDIIDTQIKSLDNKVKNLSTDAGDLSGTLPITHGGTGATTAEQARTNIGAASTGDVSSLQTAISNHTAGSNPHGITCATIGAATSSHTHSYAGSSSAGGAATSATKLETSRTIRTNLGSTASASFNGTSDVTPGVTGTLPIANGGTGATSASAARTALGAASSDHSHAYETVIKTGGTSTAYTASVSGLTELTNYVSIVITPNTTCGTSPTLNVNGIGARNIYKVISSSGNSVTSAHVTEGTLCVNGTYRLTYFGGAWYMNAIDYAPKYMYGTTDYTAGTTALDTGKLYIVYE